MCVTIRKEPVHDDTDDREEKDAETPQQLVRYIASRLEYFHCAGKHVSFLMFQYGDVNEDATYR
jgi:hypothetical protein